MLKNVRFQLSIKRKWKNLIPKMVQTSNFIFMIQEANLLGPKVEESYSKTKIIIYLRKV